MSYGVAYLIDEAGASAAEYALILAIVGGALTVAAMFLSSAIGQAVNSAGTCIASAGSNC
jgi:pilus assembly protein Flp/PilA